jgi:hypothetical protein
MAAADVIEGEDRIIVNEWSTARTVALATLAMGE